ncbi:hypothetical protein GCM10027578_17970 [Spirosoma luteolum]
MTLARLASLLTPLVLFSGIGLLMIGYGFITWGQENNVLQFLFGIPLWLGPLGLHGCIRRFTRFDTGQIWLVEGLLVGLAVYGFLRS